jgi:thiol-disulfide isomerase/thioredoxin
MLCRGACRVTLVMAALGCLVGVGMVHAQDHLFEAMGMSKVPPQAAWSFTLPTIDGQQISLQQYHGKVVFLNFWATWCIPCREEMPAVERLHQTYREGDLVVLAVDLKESAEQVKAFFQKYGLSFPALLDQNGAVFRDYLVAGMPTTYLISRDGTLLARGIGGRDWTRGEAQQLIQHLLKSSPMAQQPAPKASP